MITPDIDRYHYSPSQLKVRYTYQDFELILETEIYTFRLEKKLKGLLKSFELNEDYEWCEVINNFIINNKQKNKL